MTWLLIWIASIIINMVVILKFIKEEKGKVVCFDLLSLFVLGIIIAPLITFCILITAVIKLYNKVCNMNIMDKTIYKFK